MKLERSKEWKGKMSNCLEKLEAKCENNKEK
jgi:hypothetical protein